MKQIRKCECGRPEGVKISVGMEPIPPGMKMSIKGKLIDKNRPDLYM